MQQRSVLRVLLILLSLCFRAVRAYDFTGCCASKLKHWFDFSDTDEYGLTELDKLSSFTDKMGNAESKTVNGNVAYKLEVQNGLNAIYTNAERTSVAFFTYHLGRNPEIIMTYMTVCAKACGKRSGVTFGACTSCNGYHFGTYGQETNYVGNAGSNGARMTSVYAEYTKWHVADFFFGENAAEGFLIIDGDQSSKATFGISGKYVSQSVTGVSIIGWAGAGGHYDEQYVGEVLMFDEKLTDEERETVTTELMNKWVNSSTCDASAPPANGGAGDCTNSLASGSTCQPTCNSGYTVSGTSSCSAGTLTTATCDFTGCTSLFYGGWTRVRHVPSGTTWHPATDHLAGTDVYGDPDDESGAWSINFENAVSGYEQFLFSTGDCVKWLASTKDAVSGESYSNSERQVLASSKNEQTHEVKWYNRANFPEDPWISIDDHYVSANSNGGVLYGGNNYENSDTFHTSDLQSRGGADVYIRTSPASGSNYCDASAPPTNGGEGDCTNSLASGTMCQPTCNSGYTVSGTSSCSAGTLTAATCAANSCDASAPPTNGGAGDCTNSLASGSRCQPTCKSGYTVSGTSSCSAGTLTAATCSKILCSTNQRVKDNACISCPAGTTNADGDDASGIDTACDDIICGVNEYVSGNACQACPPGTTNADGGDIASGDDTACEKTLCAADEHVVSNACVACDGNSNLAGDDASAGDTVCDGDLCASNQRVNDNACVACASGTTNDAGDDALRGDTECDVTYCAVDQRVQDNECVTCPAGTSNTDGGDDASGEDTSCSATKCGVDEYVSSNTCAACMGGSTKPEGDDASGDDTTCACAANEHVQSNTCVACDAGETNAAGNPVPGPDTACTKVVSPPPPPPPPIVAASPPPLLPSESPPPPPSSVEGMVANAEAKTELAEVSRDALLADISDESTRAKAKLLADAAIAGVKVRKVAMALTAETGDVACAQAFLKMQLDASLGACDASVSTSRRRRLVADTAYDVTVFMSPATVDETMLAATLESLAAEGLTATSTENDPIEELRAIPGIDASSLESFAVDAAVAAEATAAASDAETTRVPPFLMPR